MNLVLILLAVFGGLALLVVLLEGRAKTLEPEQAQKLRKWIMIAVFISIVLALLKNIF